MSCYCKGPKKDVGIRDAEEAGDYSKGLSWLCLLFVVDVFNVRSKDKTFGTLQRIPEEWHRKNSKENRVQMECTVSNFDSVLCELLSRLPFKGVFHPKTVKTMLCFRGGLLLYRM